MEMICEATLLESLIRVILFLTHWKRRLMAEADNSILLTHALCYLPCSQQTL